MAKSPFFRCAALAFLTVHVSLSEGVRISSVVPLVAPTYAAVDGDPVDLGTGLYVRRSVDLVLIDAVPVIFSRTYRSKDWISRISGGTGHVGAVFEHTSTPSEYRDSRLSWNGAGWTIQLRDGAVYSFPDCPPSLNKACSVSSYPTVTGITSGCGTTNG